LYIQYYEDFERNQKEEEEERREKQGQGATD